jgi:hypothetical protein
VFHAYEFTDKWYTNSGSIMTASGKFSGAAWTLQPKELIADPDAGQFEHQLVLISG